MKLRFQISYAYVALGLREVYANFLNGDFKYEYFGWRMGAINILKVISFAGSMS